MSFAPTVIQEAIVEILRDEVYPAYGQVATVSSKGEPSVRTVHLRFIDEKQTLGFVAHTKSPKWLDLEHSPMLSGCFFHYEKGIQIRWESRVELLTSEDADQATIDLLNKRWQTTRSDIRLEYWKSALGGDAEAAQSKLEEHCPLFGAIICTPTVWDYTKICYEPYQDSRRTIYSLVDGTWIPRDVSMVHSLAT